MIRTKLLFFCSRFGGGGAEMHLLRVLSHANFDEFEIHLALTRDGGGYEERLPAQINIHYLTIGINSSFLSLIKSYRPLKELIHRLDPKGVISIMDPQNLMLCFIKKTSSNFPPITILCQNAPIKNLSSEGIRGKIFLRLIPKLYKHANQVIAICRGVHDELLQKLKVTSAIEIIYNAGYDPSYKVQSQEPIGDITFSQSIQLIACGRLNKQKGFDVLLDALAIIKDEIDFNMWILGVGEDKEQLLQQRSALGLENRVHFLGFQSNPYKFFNKAEIFVLSSRWEGFGNVLTEAMICNCAVVSTNCDFGPNEILKHNENGVLCQVESSEDLAKSLREVILNDKLRKKLKEAGAVRAEAFASEEISNQYFRKFKEVINTTN
ncbi:hypothetical protein GCM10023149_37220 [Mucilaginibacter gynuensis]|uniref:Glycosyltransferase involved in cell wall biosynthesis n=1 Tax=Mucilaginibacter gynuensis TaxID=1302236 RepID=A0ABP8GXW9_9SPHI